MKSLIIISIVYIVSILVTALVGLFSLVPRPQGRKYDVLLFIICSLLTVVFSPLVALISPVYFFRRIRDKYLKRNKGETNKYEELEEICKDADEEFVDFEAENKRLQLILETEKQMKSMQCNVLKEIDVPFFYPLAHLTNAIINGEYDNIIESLNSWLGQDEVIVSHGELKVELSKKAGHRTTCKLYILKTDGKADENIFAHLNFCNTVTGIWKAFLMHSLDTLILSLRGYVRGQKDYVFTFAYLQSVVKNLNAVDISEDKFCVEPKIYFSDDKSYIVSHYWSHWRGLVKEVVKITIDNNRAKVEFLYDEVLYDYNCGLMISY